MSKKKPKITPQDIENLAVAVAGDDLWHRYQRLATKLTMRHMKITRGGVYKWARPGGNIDDKWIPKLHRLMKEYGVKYEQG